jgi:hypothetical protein
MDNNLDAYYNMLEAIEILKVHDKVYSLEMGTILNDTLRLAQDVGVNDQAFEIGMFGQKTFLQYILNLSEHQIDQPVESRSEFFNIMLNNYYTNCKWMKKLCFKKHKSFKFFREFCNNQFDVFIRDIKYYKENFLLDELGEDYDNRRKFFKRMIKCFCLMSLMLLEKKERLIIVTIIDRYYFDTTRGLEEKDKRSAYTSAF